MIKLIESSFYREKETKQKLSKFLLNTKIFSMSKECKKFEENFAKKQIRKYAVMVNSGSSANLILIQSLLNLKKLKKGNKVGVSALTWSTNVMPLIQLGLEPIIIDCELDTLNISPNILKSYTAQLDALFITNALGFCDNIQKIKNICEENNILFLEDNCESLGSMAYDNFLGNFGLASTFSFYVGHHLSTIEGGMICTDDKDLYNALNISRAHGWSRNIDKDYKNKLEKDYNVDEFYSLYTFYDLAYCVRPTEINGFLGNIQLQYWDEIVNKRKENFNFFMSATRENNKFIKLNLEHMDLISNFAFPLIFKNQRDFIKYKEIFISNEIEIRPIIGGNIAKQPFYKKYIQNNNKCNNADHVHENGFYFGNNPDMSSKKLDKIYNLLNT